MFHPSCFTRCRSVLRANKKIGDLGGFSVDSGGRTGVIVVVREVHFDRRPSRQMKSFRWRSERIRECATARAVGCLADGAKTSDRDAGAGGNTARGRLGDGPRQRRRARPPLRDVHRCSDVACGGSRSPGGMAFRSGSRSPDAENLREDSKIPGQSWPVSTNDPVHKSHGGVGG